MAYNTAILELAATDLFRLVVITQDDPHSPRSVLDVVEFDTANAAFAATVMGDLNVQGQIHTAWGVDYGKATSAKARLAKAIAQAPEHNPN